MPKGVSRNTCAVTSSVALLSTGTISGRCSRHNCCVNPLRGSPDSADKKTRRYHSAGFFIDKYYYPTPLSLRDGSYKEKLLSHQGVTYLLANFFHRILFKLADALGRNRVDFGQLMQRRLVLTQPAALEDIPRTLVQCPQGRLQAMIGVVFPIAVFKLHSRV